MVDSRQDCPHGTLRRKCEICDGEGGQFDERALAEYIEHFYQAKF